MFKEVPARIHLLPAKGSPYVAVIRRKPSKVFHIIRWNTRNDHLEYGSWFNGKLYPKRCDISFDGKWMVYLAMGDINCNTWNGVCLLPRLRTYLESDNIGTWFGGGYWKDEKELLLNGWGKLKGSIPFKLGVLQSQFGGEDLGVLYPRLERDGWTRGGDNYGKNVRVENSKKLMIKCENDNGWYWQPSPKHPRLRMYYRGYLQQGYTFEFKLEYYPGILDSTVDWATWDFLGNLVFAKAGTLYKYKLADLKKGKPSFCQNLESLALPPKPEVS